MTVRYGSALPRVDVNVQPYLRGWGNNTPPAATPRARPPPAAPVPVPVDPFVEAEGITTVADAEVVVCSGRDCPGNLLVHAIPFYDFTDCSRPGGVTPRAMLGTGDGVSPALFRAPEFSAAAPLLPQGAQRQRRGLQRERSRASETLEATALLTPVLRWEPGRNG